MDVSQNGYTANDRSVIVPYVITPTRTMQLRRGSPGQLLAHFLRWFDAHVRDIDPGQLDDWSYAERQVRGSTDVLSNHASGTAADVDATRWPLGRKATAYLTPAEIARVHAQLVVYQGCIRWGADYDNPAYGGEPGARTDPMHFEIDRPEYICDQVWAKINGDTDMTPEQAQQLDFVYKRIAGRDSQRYLKGGPALDSFVVLEDLPAGGDKDAWPARSADVGDVITILRYLEAALSSIDQLRAQLASAGAPDAASFAAQLVDELADFRLTVTAGR